MMGYSVTTNIVGANTIPVLFSRIVGIGKWLKFHVDENQLSMYCYCHNNIVPSSAAEVDVKNDSSHNNAKCVRFSLGDQFSCSVMYTLLN